MGIKPNGKKKSDQELDDENLNVGQNLVATESKMKKSHLMHIYTIVAGHVFFSYFYGKQKSLFKHTYSLNVLRKTFSSTITLFSFYYLLLLLLLLLRLLFVVCQIIHVLWNNLIIILISRICCQRKFSFSPTLI